MICSKPERCSQCHNEYTNSWLHSRLYHTAHCDVTYRDGLKIRLLRSDGVFKCDRCEFTDQFTGTIRVSSQTFLRVTLQYSCWYRCMSWSVNIQAPRNQHLRTLSWISITRPGCRPLVLCSLESGPVMIWRTTAMSQLSVVVVTVPTRSTMRRL